MFNDLTTEKNILFWSQASGTVTNFDYESPTIKISSDKMNFEAPGEVRFEDIQADVTSKSGTIKTQIPQAILTTTISSTDFYNLELPEVTIDNPMIDVVQIPTDQSNAKPLNIPFDFMMNSLQINNAKLNYKLKDVDDSTKISATVNISGDLLQSSGGQPESINFSQMNMILSQIIIHKNNLDVAIPSMELAGTDGSIYDSEGLTGFKSLISGNWNGVNASAPLKKGAKVLIRNFSGLIDESPLDLKKGAKLSWNEWMNKTHVIGGAMLFSDSTKDISFSNAQWLPASRELQIDSFILQPKLSPAEYFSKTVWQSDYIQLNGAFLPFPGRF